jgi:hypothetical protein
MDDATEQPPHLATKLSPTPTPWSYYFVRFVPS